MGSQTVVRAGRRSVSVAAVIAVLAALLAMIGLGSAPAYAADTITFRAGAQAAFNQPTARVTIPATVRETDGMLLFVTSEPGRGQITTPPAGWTLEGTRQSSTDTDDDPLQQGRRGQRCRPQRGRDVLGDHQVHHHPARL